MSLYAHRARTIGFDLIDEVRGEGTVGKSIDKCIQCGSCVPVCVISTYLYEFNPREVIARARTGSLELMSSFIPWFCATCYMCNDRCPKKIKVVELLEVIKNVAARRGLLPEKIVDLNRNVAELGRLFELDEFNDFLREEMDLSPVEKLDPEDIKKMIKNTLYDRTLKD